MELEQIIEGLLGLYYAVYPEMERIVTNIILTDDLDRSHRELRPDLSSQIDEHARESVDYNGRMVLPVSLDENITVLLNTKKILEYTNDRSMTWVGTFAHEHTHAIDYYSMARLEALDSYDPLQQISRYHMFQLWSEYHARKLGYGFLRKFLATDDGTISKEERLEHIQNYEWPFHREKHFRDYHADTNGDQQMYITMQLLGRYAVWCDLFPTEFNENIFAETYGNTPWMHHLFSFLRQHETLDAICGNFEEMKLILSENWCEM